MVVSEVAWVISTTGTKSRSAERRVAAGWRCMMLSKEMSEAAMRVAMPAIDPGRSRTDRRT